MSGNTVTEVPANEFAWALQYRIATISRRDFKLAHVNPRFKLYIDSQTKVLGFMLAELPERDPYAIPSSWYLIIRHAMLFGVPNETLYEWAAQTEGFH